MSELKNPGVKITLDIEREMVFSLNVLDACIEKYGKMDDMLNNTSKDLSATVWLATQMCNEGAEIHNDMFPDNKIPLIDESKLKRYVNGLGGIRDLQQKVQEAILKGLPEEAVQQVVEMGEQIAVQMNRKQRRAKK
jgi:cobalamin biosynthesis Co2+ chelatase CbiK